MGRVNDYNFPQMDKPDSISAELSDTVQNSVGSVKSAFAVVDTADFKKNGNAAKVVGEYDDVEMARDCARRHVAVNKVPHSVLTKSGNAYTALNTYIIKTSAHDVSLKEFTETNFSKSYLDDLGYKPQVKRGMQLSDFEEIVHTTIAYIKKKYPNERNTMDRWIVLAGEEFGEICRAIQDGDINNTVEEITQTIACLYLMAEEFIKTQGV